MENVKIENKQSNVFVRAGGWVKGLFTKAKPAARKRGSLRAKPRTVSERAKISLYRTRNVVKVAVAKVTTMARTVVAKVSTLAKRAWAHVGPHIKYVLQAAGEVGLSIVSLVTFIALSTLMVEGVVLVSAFIGEALAASFAFVALYLVAYYGVEKLSGWLRQRQMSRLIGATEYAADHASDFLREDEDMANSTRLELVHT